MEWTRAWSAPARDDYGTWAAVASVLAAVGVGLWFLDGFLDGIIPAVGVLCVLASFYVLLGIFFGLPVPPTRAGWETYKVERHREFLLLRDGLWALVGELTGALTHLEMELNSRRYSGMMIHQDKWTQHGQSIRNLPIFADVRDPIGAAYQVIGTQSQRSYDAHLGGHPRMPANEANDLREAIALVRAARDAATAKLAELGIEQP
jgi:hypothetical protein